jgi:Uma2 family endonuclease
MSNAALKLPPLMTVAEFQHWEGEAGVRYELVDGVPRAMAPASDAHGTIHTNLISRIDRHLEAKRPGCRLVTTPGVQPRLRADWNHRIPELAVTCSANVAGTVMTPDPILIVEVLSPFNAQDTWSNVPLYASLPSVMEIVLVHSTAVRAEVLRRGQDGNWPPNPDIIAGLDATLLMPSIGLDLPLAAIYRNTHFERG